MRCDSVRVPPLSSVGWGTRPSEGCRRRIRETAYKYLRYITLMLDIQCIYYLWYQAPFRLCYCTTRVDLIAIFIISSSPPSLLLSSLPPLSLLQFSSSTLFPSVPSFFIHLPLLFISLLPLSLLPFSPSSLLPWFLWEHTEPQGERSVHRRAQVWSCSRASDEDMTLQP